MGILNPNWPRWIFASTADHFKQAADNIGLPMLIEGIDEREAEKMRADDHVEFRINGPAVRELSRGYFRLDVDVNLDFMYEFATTGTNEAISPMDAIKGKGGAAEWVSSSVDPYEPYAVDIEVEHIPPCGGADMEITIFPDFRADSKEFDLGEATIERSTSHRAPKRSCVSF